MMNILKSFYFNEKKIYCAPILFLLFFLILFSSCNNSLSILQRKYRSGYSVNYSGKVNRSNQRAEEEEVSGTFKTDTLTAQNEEDNLLASSDNSKLYLKGYKSPDFVIACDTPPKKSVEEPWSLYKPKEATPHRNSKWKQIEPFNLVTFFVLLLGVIVANILNPAGILFFFLILLLIFILSLISLIRIKKHPKQYSKLSIVFDWIFVTIGAGIITGFLIVLLLMLAGA